MGLVEPNIWNVWIIHFAGFVITAWAAVLMWRMRTEYAPWAFWGYVVAVVGFYWYGEGGSALAYAIVGEASFPYPYHIMDMGRPSLMNWAGLGMLTIGTICIFVDWHSMRDSDE